MFSIWKKTNKIAFIFLISAIIAMIAGLSLIGTTQLKQGDSSISGFSFLKLLSIWNLLTNNISKLDPEGKILFNLGSWTQLRFGTLLAGVATPVLLLSTIGILIFVWLTRKLGKTLGFLIKFILLLILLAAGVVVVGLVLYLTKQGPEWLNNIKLLVLAF